MRAREEMRGYPCGFCYAEPGERCSTLTSGRMTDTVHSSRYRRWWRAVGEPAFEAARAAHRVEAALGPRRPGDPA